MSTEAVRIPAGGAVLEGDLAVPGDAGVVVVFAHGSGSSRHSPRNRHVAEVLNAHGLGTLLMDLLSAQEEAVDLRTRELRFDIPLLADRLVAATDYLTEHPATAGVPPAYFGASTGAACALVAAAERPAVRAVVSRGGRPDLASDALGRVTAPTLLVVGSRDETVLGMNRKARERMVAAPTELAVVEGATHLFEEPGALDRVAALAADWFARYR